MSYPILSKFEKDCSPTPKFMTMNDWSRFSGISRSKTYELLSSGELEAVKAGGRTLIDVDQGLGWLSSRPKWKTN